MEPHQRNIFYRYLFPGWLYKDATKGNMFERSAALRHNVQHRRWLMVYLRRWAVIFVINWAVAELLKWVGWNYCSIPFFVVAVGSVSYGAVLWTAHALLTNEK